LSYTRFNRVFAVITSCNDRRERLSLQTMTVFAEWWVKKINYEKFPFTDTVALFHISIADFLATMSLKPVT